MTETIITALISGGVTLAVCMINNRNQYKKTQAQHDETLGLIEYKLDELTKKVEKHNSTVERTYKLEEKATLHEEKIKVMNHRIEDLERKEC